MSKVLLSDYSQLISRPLILDGAIGSFLQNSNHKLDPILWSSILNIYKPEVILDLHKQYISSGAEIITTNTFRTNPYALEKSNYNFNIENFIKKSIDLAKNSIETEGVYIAGSNAPAEDCYQKERTLSYNKLEYNHKKHIELLYENGVDFILNETIGHFDEIGIIAKFCSDNNIPFIISLYTETGETILSGHSIEEIIKFIIYYKPMALSFNCVSHEIFKKINNELFKEFKNGYYLNMGDTKRDGLFTNVITPKKYKEFIKQNINKNALFIGGCCGSTPKHISKIKELFDEIY
ncbi:MAG TPA: homocysteine S-methyltransferase family protein [Melioribacteraceae bacterium]|nr:homocysteine S-methyltransferase family protein [Melioribacteraceae bacterium]